MLLHKMIIHGYRLRMKGSKPPSYLRIDDSKKFFMTMNAEEALICLSIESAHMIIESYRTKEKFRLEIDPIYEFKTTKV